MALAALAGCSSSSGLSSRLTRVPNIHSHEASPLAKSVPPTNSPSLLSADRVATMVPPTSSAHHNEFALAPAATTPQQPGGSPPVNDWVALRNWCDLNQVGAPKRLSSATNLTYELRAAGGVIALTAGSSLAHFNGLNYWLGYAPRLTNGELLVHSLDARKNLLPLAQLSTPPHETNPVVVIDPGHGGENTGARSVRDDRFEKDFTLDWALRLQPLLEGRGWKVYLTRTNDVDLILPDRVALAAERKASLFLSLHFNSAARRDQSGLETYCLTPAGLPSTLTRDYEDDTALAFPNNAFDSQNLRYALRLHRSLVGTTGGVDRGVRRARFMGVLRTQNRPAVLLEAGYLSNPREAQLIGQPEYRQKLAEAVAKALLITHETPVEAKALFDAEGVGAWSQCMLKKTKGGFP
jgi:N-acetylmuramoyl-L-alanine amidase